MWDILDIQDGDIHGEGLQNRTESQVGKDQMGGESEKGERGERTDGSEMEGAEQNEKRRQGYPVAEQCHGLGPVNTKDANAFHQVVNEHVRSRSISFRWLKDNILNKTTDNGIMALGQDLPNVAPPRWTRDALLPVSGLKRDLIQRLNGRCSRAPTQCVWFSRRSRVPGDGLRARSVVDRA